MVALIRDVAELKTFLAGVQKNFSEGTIMPFVEQAEMRYLEPFLGPDFIDELLAALDSTSGPNQQQAAVLKLLQRSLAYYTLLDALPFLNVSVGNAGVQENLTANSAPVRQWGYYNLETTSAANGDEFLDKALAYLERNASAFPTWTASEAYTLSHDLFISSAAELSKYLHISNSRRAYLALRPFIGRVEELTILPILCEDLFNELKAVPADPEPAYRKPLLALISKTLAHLALAESLPEISLVITGNGIRIASENDGVKQRMAATQEQISALKLKAETTGSTYLAGLKKYLDEKAETIPAYLNSPCYSSTTRHSYQLPDNSNKPSFRV